MPTYEGHRKDGVMHGYGTLLYDNGDRYIGEWKNGKRHGLGAYLAKSGDLYYGQYKDGKWHGFGFMELSNGERRFGQWKESKFHGLNIAKKDKEYEIGISKNNYLNGKCAVFSEDGSIIECGIFVDGKLSDEEWNFDDDDGDDDDYDGDDDDYDWFPAGGGGHGRGGRTSNDDRSESLNPNSPRYNPGRRR